LLRDVAFVTMVIASVSTLVFNANPLLRFDGYYVFCDLFDLPNLAARSRRFWNERLRNLIGAREEAGTVNLSPGEAKWLWVYAPSAWMYRLAIAAIVVTWIGRYSLPLGIAAAIYSVVTLVVMPLAAIVRMLLASTLGTHRHSRTRIAVAGVAALAFIAALAMPMPFHTSAWGVVWLPEQAHVRAQTEGFVARFEVGDGAQVLPGQLLVTLEDPALVAQRTRLIARIEELQADRFDTLLRDTLRTSNTQESIDRNRAELARIEERIGQLQTRAQVGGVAIMPRQSDTLGTFVQRGASLGYVLDRREILIRAAVPQRDAALVRERHRGAEVRLAEEIAEVLPAVLVRDIPAAVYELPNRALGMSGGGPYATDPTDQAGLRTQEPVVHIDLALPDRILDRVGSRVWIRFDHGLASLGEQSYRRMRQVFLQYFDPAG
jgi:putative peptide zinc metalloprotease protein